MILLQSSVKITLLTVTILTIMVTLVSSQVAPALAQTTPTPSNLEKRNYSYLDDQHLTARFGNSKVCGDHLCAPGEWSNLQQNLNHAQISHPANATKPAKVPTQPITSSTVSVNSTTIQSKNMTLPTPIPAPPTVSSSICATVKAVLGNSTASNIVAKIMNDLGCSK
jgi:hypothetical protein